MKQKKQKNKVIFRLEEKINSEKTEIYVNYSRETARI